MGRFSSDRSPLGEPIVDTISGLPAAKGSVAKIPLGANAVRRDLGEDLMARLTRIVRDAVAAIRAM